MSSNGAIPLSELTAVGGGFYMQHNAAAAFTAMRAACAAATGVQLVISPGDGAYRTLAEQQHELDLWRAEGSQGTRPANPGGSNHGWGTAVDIANWGSAGSWLPANAARFNFSRPFSDEGWHFQYVGAITAADTSEPLINMEDTVEFPFICLYKGNEKYQVIYEDGEVREWWGNAAQLAEVVKFLTGNAEYWPNGKKEGYACVFSSKAQFDFFTDYFRSPVQGGVTDPAALQKMVDAAFEHLDLDPLVTKLEDALPKPLTAAQIGDAVAAEAADRLDGVNDGR